MNNGLTSVFISVLSISASTLATTDRQRALAIWFASHDQGVCGSGIVGFDVCDLPWRHESFDGDKAFVLAAIDSAYSKNGWDKLSYKPKEEWVLESLREFREMVNQFAPEHVDSDRVMELKLERMPTEFKVCEKHGVYLHAHGCVVCHDS
ncbi:hypothetical protein ACO0K9_19115 [Undibacterium sp. Ji50W]|uniref:hypothetical protein n=1 Tax=Undibacterium sp. Ji50W TaxID=3413041 RepID=UPI003BF00EC6